MQNVTTVRGIAALFFATMLHPLYAQGDLDYERAHRSYLAEQSEADRLNSIYQRENSTLEGFNQAVSRANSDAEEARGRLRRSQNDLSTAESNLRSRERDLSNVQADLVNLNTSLTRLQSNRPDLEQKRERLNRHIEQHTRRLERLEDQLQRLRQDPEANADRIAQLESEKSSLSTELSSDQSDLQDTERRLQRLDREVRDTQDSIAQRERDANQYRSDISAYDREISRLQSDINYQRSEVSRAEDRVRDAERDASNQYAIAQRAYANYEAQSSRAQAALNYYNQVVANYNAALNAVYRSADQAAANHAALEARDRAISVAEVDGLAAGRSVGTTAGTGDGQALKNIQGYRAARANPRLQPNFEASYNNGVQAGVQIANSNAKSENYPQGYNEALAAALASSAANEATLDLRGEVTATPGEASPELSTSKMTVTPVQAPAFAVPSETTASVPAYQRPRVNIPNANESYANAPCNNLVLAEFEPKCRARYRDSYASSFRSQYESTYVAAYKPKFESAVAQSYDQYRNAEYPENYNAGGIKGAGDQGILDGFAKQISTARTEQFAKGKSDFASLRAKSHLVVAKDFSLSDRNNDGVYSPGETVDLNLVVENLGERATPDRKLKLVVKVKVGVASLTFETRDLPSIAGNTRLNIIGATTLTSQNLFAGQQVKVEGELQSGNGGVYQKLQSFSLAKELHYPLELVDISFAKKPAVNEKVKATFKFRNLSNAATEESAVELSVPNGRATVTAEAALSVPVLEPGTEATVEAEVAPGIWTGEYIFTRFVSKLTPNVEGGVITEQPFNKAVAVNRVASLRVLDARGAAIPSGALLVRAGTQLTLFAQMEYHATVARPGPFVVRKSQVSTTEITNPNNSTLSRTLGGWGPNNSPQRVQFDYIIPQSLKGKKAWIMLQVDEAGRALHAPVIDLIVE